MIRHTVAMAAISCLWTFPSAGDDNTAPIPNKPMPDEQLPQEKQTTLALYVTSKEAYEKWKAAPGETKILDVRTPEEYIYVGHAEMSWNIPLAFQTYKWDEEQGYFGYRPNASFVDDVKKWAEPSDTILVMCRSGGRSAMAVNLLAKSGFKIVYNITDGMEGDTVSDATSLYQGKRMKNGWKNSGLPWTYKVDPEKVRVPQAD